MGVLFNFVRKNNVYFLSNLLYLIRVNNCTNYVNATRGQYFTIIQFKILHEKKNYMWYLL